MHRSKEDPHRGEQWGLVASPHGAAAGPAGEAAGSGGERTPRVAFHALARPGGYAQIRPRLRGTKPPDTTPRAASQPSQPAPRRSVRRLQHGEASEERKRASSSSNDNDVVRPQLCCLQRDLLEPDPWFFFFFLSFSFPPPSILPGSLWGSFEAGYLGVHRLEPCRSFFDPPSLIPPPPHVQMAPSLDISTQACLSVGMVRWGGLIHLAHACHRGLGAMTSSDLC